MLDRLDLVQHGMEIENHHAYPGHMTNVMTGAPYIPSSSSIPQCFADTSAQQSTDMTSTRSQARPISLRDKACILPHLRVADAVVAGGDDEEAALVGERVDGLLEVGGVAVRRVAGLTAVRIGHDAHALGVAPAPERYRRIKIMTQEVIQETESVNLMR